MDFLFDLAINEQAGFRWRLSGAVPPIEAFQHDLWSGVLSQFVVVERRSERPVGTVVAYNAELHHGYAFLAGAMVPALRNRGIGIEAFHLFVEFLFSTHNLRKLYAEVPEYNLHEFFGRSANLLLKEEGRFRQHTYYDGRFWDRIILAVYRDDYFALTKHHGVRRLRPAPSPSPWTGDGALSARGAASERR